MADKPDDGFEKLRVRPVYRLGQEHGFLIHMKRRVSVPVESLLEWSDADLEGYRLGVQEYKR